MKKTILLLYFTLCILHFTFSQAGEWVWMHGSNMGNIAATYGVQGVPAPANNPPGLYEPCEWKDLNGNFWVFGGSQNSTYGYEDLWKYDPLTNEWTWMKGSGLPNDSGNFGVKGVAAASNLPPARGYGAATWVDSQNNLWMYGGHHLLLGVWSDLWKYSIAANEWTWMSGSDSVNQLPVYGTLGIPSPLNFPGERRECCAAWTDANDNLWLFGSEGGTDLHNDLWRYDISTNEWTWMKGPNIANQPGVYGTITVEDPANIPGSRGTYSHWKDSSGKLWLCGGRDFLNNINFIDLWRFNITTNNWAWMGGGSTGAGNYGTQCIGSPTNYPPPRFENRAAWSDQDGNFWFFGGGQNTSVMYNDLWMYNTSTAKWVWVSGNNTTNSLGSWGTMGVSSPTNKPNARTGSVGWNDNNGHFYIFSGVSAGFLFHYNDLWKYTYDPNCPLFNSVEENNPLNQLLIFPNPANSSFTISFPSSEKQNVELRIYNTLGKQIYVEKEEITIGKFEKEINVEKLSDGIYFLQLKTKGGNLNRKIIVNH